jgi:hypothetical protein
MAHFAEIDSNNIVLRVLVVDNSEEHRGQEFLANDLSLGGTWIQTSYSASFRKNFAGIGYTYDSTRDAFIAPKPYPSWILNETTCNWDSPTPRPASEGHWQWDEDTLQWTD